MTREGCCIEITSCTDWEPRACQNGEDFTCKGCGQGYCNAHMLDNVRHPETGFCDDCRLNHTCMECSKVVPENLIDDCCPACHAKES